MPLLTGLCFFLRKTKDPVFLYQQAKTICHDIQTMNNTTDNDNHHHHHHDSLEIPPSQCNIHETLYRMVTTTLLSSSTSATTAKAKPDLELVPTMIALGYAIKQQQLLLLRKHNKNAENQTDDDDTEQLPDQQRWIQALVDYTTSSFPDAMELMILQGRPCHNGLLSSLSMETWQSPSVLPLILLKLKSHPDRMLSSLYGYLPLSKDSSCHFPIITEEFISVLVKQLIHVDRPTNRYYATNILYAWAMTDSSNTTTRNNSHNETNDPSSPVSSSFTMICEYMMNSMKPIPTNSVARTAIYQFLEQLAIGYQTTVSSYVDTHQKLISSELINDMLLILYNMIQKEIKSEVRLIGLEAMTEWIIIYKTMEQQRNDTTTSSGVVVSTSFETILQEFIRTPIQQSASGTKKISDTQVLPLLTLFVKRIVDTDSILSSIVADIWINDKEWDKAIETIVTTSSLKKSTITDAVLLLYLVVFNFRNSNNSTNSKKSILPAWIQKIITAGNIVLVSPAANSTLASAAGKNVDPNVSFFCSILDVITSNGIINTLLPRTIALYSECCCATAATVVPSSTAKSKSEASSLLFLVSKSNEPTLLSSIIALCIMSPFTMVVTPTSALIPSHSKKRQKEYSRHFASHAILEIVGLPLHFYFL